MDGNPSIAHNKVIHNINQRQVDSNLDFQLQFFFSVGGGIFVFILTVTVRPLGVSNSPTSQQCHLPTLVLLPNLCFFDFSDPFFASQLPIFVRRIHYQKYFCALVLPYYFIKLYSSSLQVSIASPFYVSSMEQQLNSTWAFESGRFILLIIN